MMWQDLIFTMGSIFGIVVLTPTLRNRTASIPLGTSLPSALIGIVYGTTFLTMGMTYSALGAYATGTLWSLIAAVRSPRSPLSAADSQSTVDSQSAAPQQGHAPAGD